MKYKHFESLPALLEQRLIPRRPHPLLPLDIYNYSAAAQFMPLSEWTEPMKDCRGLILDRVGEIVGRPFRKFWNYEQVLGEIPATEPFTVWEKLDGSLGILYWWDGVPRIATRGSFESAQAICGTDMLHTLYSNSRLDSNYTYLFEIIAKHNRIVVDYGGRKALVLLAVIHTATGHELDDLPNLGFPLAKQYEKATWHTGKFTQWDLPAWPTRDDRRQHSVDIPGMENMHEVQEGSTARLDSPHDSQTETRKAEVRSGVEQKEPSASAEVAQRPMPGVSETTGSTEENSMCGLRANISTLCDGLRSSARREEVVLHRPRRWFGESDLDGDKERNRQVRCGLCQLSSDSNTWGESATSVDVAQGTNEGFVIRWWPSGFRAKVKLAEYKRLHRLITQCSTRTIWELLRSGNDVQELLDRVPADFEQWARDQIQSLQGAYSDLVAHANELFAGAPKGVHRREFAEYAKQTSRHPGLLFSLLDGKDISDSVWQFVEPKWATPFRKEAE